METQLSLNRSTLIASTVCGIFRDRQEVCVSQVFFLFSSTKIGHGRPSVKDRYAISDKNILRSFLVRYFYLKFLACRSSMPCERYQKKGKKMLGAVHGGGRRAFARINSIFLISLFLCDGHVIVHFYSVFSLLPTSMSGAKGHFFIVLKAIYYSVASCGGAFRPAS